MDEVDTYSSFYNQHSFIIRDTYLDIHPLDAYIKLAGLYGLKRDTAFTTLFQLSFSEQPLSKNTFYQEVRALNEEVLDRSGQQKLQRYPKKKFGSNTSAKEDAERKLRMAAWQQIIKSTKLAPVGHGQQIRQLEWTERVKLYTEVSLE